MSELLFSLLSKYGYALIFGGILLENAGIPSPGHSLMLAAGFFAHEGHLSLFFVIAIGCAAAFLGDNLGYWLGREKGDLLFQKFPKATSLFTKHRPSFESFVQRRGIIAVVLVRFLPGLQLVGAFFFGMSGMKPVPFLVFNFLGAVIWSVLYATLGYFFGSSWNYLHEILGKAGLLLFIVFALGLGFYLAQHKIKTLLEFLKNHLGVWARSMVFLTLVCALFLFFFKLTTEMNERETTGFDAFIIQFLQRHNSSKTITALKFFTALASVQGILILVGVGTIWGVLKKKYLDTATFVLVVTMSELLNISLKTLISRPRPDSMAALVEIHGSSYPSGHAMAAASAFSAFAFLATRIHSSHEKFIFSVAFFLIFFVGVSRISLGAHFPTDVLAGVSAGLAVSLTGELFLEFLTGKQSFSSGPLGPSQQNDHLLGKNQARLPSKDDSNPT